MLSPLLTAHNISQSYGASVALASASAEFYAGSSTAIMGTSGSGKTTFLHALAGIIVPDSGEVVYAGLALHAASDSARTKLRSTDFGFVFQQGMLLPELTVIENVALPLLLLGSKKREALEVSAMWLVRLGLAGFEKRRIGELSGGQMQRVAIARAQVSEPKIIFADEPTGSLDSSTSREVLAALLESTHTRSGTLIMVTHDLAVAEQCSRILRMEDGGILDSADKKTTVKH